MVFFSLELFLLGLSHALKLIRTIKLYTSLVQKVTSLPDLPGLFGTRV